MGSFSSTCCVSGLPIEYGDPVRYLLLTESPYKTDNLKCNVNSMWFPRTWALRAKYNDYGSVEHVEEGAAKQAWLDSLKFDLVSVGIGENRYHDVSTSKDMSFEKLTKALWEARVRVKREVSMWVLDPERQKLFDALPPLSKHRRPKGVPTRKRIQKVFEAHGIKVFNESHGENSFIISSQGYGRIRVRADYGEKPGALEHVEAVIKGAGYATMITKGTGPYTHSAELLIRPLPSIENYRYYSRVAADKSLHVGQAMIREDIWKALCNIKLETSDWQSGTSIETFRLAAKQSWLTATHDIGGPSLDDNNPYSAFFLRDEIPFTVGTGTMFKLQAKKFKTGEMKEEEIGSFLDNAAEQAFLTNLFQLMRYQWRPTYSNGPQFGDWSVHQQVTVALAHVAQAKYQREDEDQE